MQRGEHEMQLARSAAPPRLPSAPAAGHSQGRPPTFSPDCDFHYPALRDWPTARGRP